MVTWVVFLTIGLVIGIAAGFFFGQLDEVKRRQREELQAKLAHTEKALEDYKHEVTEHFMKTSNLVNNLTESYKAVHEHLAGGAKVLCQGQFEVEKLNIESVKLIDAKAEEPVSSVISSSAKAEVLATPPVNSNKTDLDKIDIEGAEKLVSVSGADSSPSQNVNSNRDKSKEKLNPQISVSDVDNNTQSTSVAKTTDIKSNTNQQDQDTVSSLRSRTVH